MNANRGKRKNNKWEDHYTRKAKKERFPARSVYKLEEIQKKHRLIKKGDRVLDLGCFPGSWLLYAADLVGKKGAVVGMDLKPVSIKLPSNVTVFTRDITDDNSDILPDDKKFNVIMSDMAPATSGNKNVDNARSFNLCCDALSLAKRYLLSGGTYMCKIFHGEDFTTYINLVKKNFKKQITFKPQSCRKASKEIYIIGLDFQEETDVRT